MEGLTRKQDGGETWTAICYMFVIENLDTHGFPSDKMNLCDSRLFSTGQAQNQGNNYQMNRRRHTTVLYATL